MEGEQKRCFVICHFGQEGSKARREADYVCDKIIKPALAELNVKLERADRMKKPGRITDKVLRAIRESDVCIADLTGHNPNVFYELAVAQVIGRPLVLMTRSPKNIPFNIKDYEVMPYDLRGDQRRRYVKELGEFLQGILSPNYRAPQLLPNPDRKVRWFPDQQDPHIRPYLFDFIKNARDVAIFSTSFSWARDDFVEMFREKTEKAGEVLLFIPRVNTHARRIRDGAAAQVREYVGDSVRFTLINRQQAAGRKLRVGQRQADDSFLITDYEYRTDSELVGAFSSLILTTKMNVKPCVD